MRNGYKLLMLIRWRKIYGFRNMAKMDYIGRTAARYALTDYLAKARLSSHR